MPSENVADPPAKFDMARQAAAFMSMILLSALVFMAIIGAIYQVSLAVG